MPLLGRASSAHPQGGNPMLRPIVGSMHSVLVLLVAAPSLEVAQGQSYPDRKTIIVSNCPFVQLTALTRDEHPDQMGITWENLSWKNVAAQPVVALEVVTLYFDIFDRRMKALTWSVTGRTRAEAHPLAPGESRSDRATGYTEPGALTSVVY